MKSYWLRIVKIEKALTVTYRTLLLMTTNFETVTHPKHNRHCRDFAKILQIGMLSHNMELLKIICVLYQFHHSTLPTVKIDRGQIHFWEFVLTGMESYSSVHLVSSYLGLTYALLLETNPFSRTCFYFSGMCTSNIPLYFLDFATEIFTSAISSVPRYFSYKV